MNSRTSHLIHKRVCMFYSCPVIKFDHFSFSLQSETVLYRQSQTTFERCWWASHFCWYSKAFFSLNSLPSPPQPLYIYCQWIEAAVDQLWACTGDENPEDTWRILLTGQRTHSNFQFQCCKSFWIHFMFPLENISEIFNRNMQVFLSSKSSS